MKERELSANFSEYYTGLPYLSEYDLLIPEFKVMQGIADYIAVSSAKVLEAEVKKYRVIPRSMHATASDVMSNLFLNSVRSFDNLVSNSRYDWRTIRKTLHYLVNEGIVTTRGPNYLCSKDWLLPSLDIAAFEIKIHDWQRALFQTQQYKAFATRSIAVFPKMSDQIIEKMVPCFKMRSIGIAFMETESQSCRFVVRPTRNNCYLKRHYLYSIIELAHRL